MGKNQNNSQLIGILWGTELIKSAEMLGQGSEVHIKESTQIFYFLS